MSQTRSELRRKYYSDDGQHYEVRPGVVMTVSLTGEDLAREIVIAPQGVQMTENARVNGMSPARLTKIIDEIVPSSERGRLLRDDVTMHCVTIPRGGMTLWVIGSANRDETVFANPDRLDITRAEQASVVWVWDTLLPRRAARTYGGANRHQHTAEAYSHPAPERFSGVAALASKSDSARAGRAASEFLALTAFEEISCLHGFIPS